MLIPVILCGGAGTRLWPVSREAHPKPFMRLQDGQSLLQKTLLRAAALPGVEALLTVANRELYFHTEDHYQEVATGTLQFGYLLEPFGRNTAPAVAAAAIEVEARWGGDACMLVLPADHMITDTAAFSVAVAAATSLAAAGHLVTFGIRPDRPETGFGYIERDEAARLGENAFGVRRFVEKPALATAQAYLAGGGFSWNSGMFCFTAATVLGELRRYADGVFDGVAACRAASRPAERVGGGFVVELDAATFNRVPDVSLDYALMEKTDRAAVVCCDIGWSDIGSWTAVSELHAADAQGNAVVGEALLQDVGNCFIRSETRMVGAVGINDLVIIDTPDALLVAHRDRVQDVKQIAARLKAAGHDSHKLHRTVHRPWGIYTVLDEGPRFKIKLITVKPGASLSLQMHHHRNEHWIVVSGMARVINGDQETFVNTNESTYIPAGHQHRLSNPGMLDLVMIEVQSGDYLGEDDIVRFEDRYGRLQT